jgi:hypothetical protein
MALVRRAGDEHLEAPPQLADMTMSPWMPSSRIAVRDICRERLCSPGRLPCTAFLERGQKDSSHQPLHLSLAGPGVAGGRKQLIKPRLIAYRSDRFGSLLEELERLAEPA